MAISNRRNNQINFDKVDLDKKMGQFLDVGRQFVDGVSGARPGQRRPTNIREFSIRNNSGGAGIFSGGNGLVREIEFLDSLNTAILSERRVHQPYGLNGGDPGRRGRNLFIRNDGVILHLGGKNEISAEPGDRIRIETPGGGGYGKK